MISTANYLNSAYLQSVMHVKVPLQFVDLSFQECFYYWRHHDDDFFSIEEEFNRCLREYQPAISHPQLGDRLRIREWKSLRKSSEQPKQLLFQVLNMMPTKDSRHGVEKQDHFLHNLVVKPWKVHEEDTLMSPWGKGRTYLEAMYNLSHFEIVLDRPLHCSVLHLFKEGHLGLLLDISTADDLLFISEQLPKTERFLYFDGTIQTGNSPESCLQNAQRHSKAIDIRHTFGFIDSAFVTLAEESIDPTLKNVNAIIVDSIWDIYNNDLNGQPRPN